MNDSSVCPLCEGEIASVCATIGGFRIWRCAGCTLEWVDRQDLREAEEKASYDNYGYNQELSVHFERMKPLYARGFRRRVRRTLGTARLESRAFLDVGCANGEYLWAARSLGFGRTDGVEVDTAAMAVAASYGRVVDSVEKLDRSYDVIQIKNVISNIPDFVSFVRDCLKRLKSEGWMFLDVLNQGGLSSHVRILLRKPGRYGSLRPPYVINAFRARSLRILLDRVGLDAAYFRTRHMGSAMFPQKPLHNPRLYLGAVGTLAGMGTMLTTDSRLRDVSPGRPGR